MNTCWNNNEIIKIMIMKLILILLMIMIMTRIMNLLARKKSRAKSAGKSNFSRVVRELAVASWFGQQLLSFQGYVGSFVLAFSLPTLSSNF